MHPNSSAAGAIALTINGAIPLNDTSADPLALAHAARLNGNVEFDLSNPTLPDLFDAKAVSGALKFTAHDDAVDITFLHDIAVQGLEIAPRLAPPQLRRRLSGFLTLSTPPSAPLRLRNTFDKPTLDLPNDMIATTPDDRIALPKGATFRFNPRLSFIDADIPRLTFQTDKLGVTGFPSRVSGTLENVRLTPLQALGKYRLSAAGTLAQPPLSGQLRAAISGSFKQRGPTFILTADVNSVLNVSDLDIAETVQSAAPLRKSVV